MWYGISYFQNYYAISNPNPSLFHDIISIQKALKLCPSTQTPYHLVRTLFWINTLPPSSGSPLQQYISLKHCSPDNMLFQTRLYHIMYLQHWKSVVKKPWNITDKCGWLILRKLNDKYNIIFLPTQYLMLQCFAPLLCYSLFYFPRWNKKGKRYNKINTSRPFWIANYWEFYILSAYK